MTVVETRRQTLVYLLTVEKTVPQEDVLKKLIAGAWLTAAALLLVVPAHANLIIDATFDSTITSDTNSGLIEGAINTAIQTFENTYANNAR